MYFLLCLFPGILELFYLPLVMQPEEQRSIALKKDNCYGAGFFAGVFVSWCKRFNRKVKVTILPFLILFNLIAFPAGAGTGKAGKTKQVKMPVYLFMDPCLNCQHNS